jgi:hypothetical protein
MPNKTTVVRVCRSARLAIFVGISAMLFRAPSAGSQSVGDRLRQAAQSALQAKTDSAAKDRPSSTAKTGNTVLVGTWRDENSQITYRSAPDPVADRDGTFSMKWDTGAEASGDWALKGAQLRRTTTRRKPANGDWSSVRVVSVDEILSLTQDALQTRDQGGIWNSKRVPNETRAATDDVLEAARAHVAKESDDSHWTAAGKQAIRDNAVAVQLLIEKARATPAVSPAFGKCVTMETAYSDGLIPSIQSAQKTSERKSEIDLYEGLVSVYRVERATVGEGICAWKLVAWANGLADFNPKQFESDPRLGQFGATDMLSRVFTLQCRQAGDEVRVLKPYSLNCASTFSRDVVAKLDDKDLAPAAFKRLNTLLVSSLPPEFVVFDKMAEVVYSFSRFSPANQAAYCRAMWYGGCP